MSAVNSIVQLHLGIALRQRALGEGVGKQMLLGISSLLPLPKKTIYSLDPVLWPAALPELDAFGKTSIITGNLLRTTYHDVVSLRSKAILASFCLLTELEKLDQFWEKTRLESLQAESEECEPTIASFSNKIVGYDVVDQFFRSMLYRTAISNNELEKVRAERFSNSLSDRGLFTSQGCAQSYAQWADSAFLEHVPHVVCAISRLML
jgi:hypothetical protein